MGWLSIYTSPESGVSSLTMCFKRTLLPVPEGPMMQKVSPALISRLMSLSTWLVPKYLFSFSIRIPTPLVSCRSTGRFAVSEWKKEWDRPCFSFSNTNFPLFVGKDAVIRALAPDYGFISCSKGWPGTLQETGHIVTDKTATWQAENVCGN